MIDLERIKVRRAATPPYWGSGTLRVSDIDALIAEVERLRVERDKVRVDAINFGMQITVVAGEIEKLNRALELCEVGLVPSDAEEANDLQLCGHPRSAIIIHHDLDSDHCSNYCSMCHAEGEGK